MKEGCAHAGMAIEYLCGNSRLCVDFSIYTNDQLSLGSWALF
jgi:hypothetical protein